MELVNLPKEEKEKELSGKQKENLFTSIVLGKDVIEEVETSKGKFKVKYPRMNDIETIGRRTAYRLNGLSASSFDMATYGLIQKIAALDTLVVSGPDWFENAKKEVNLQWGDMPTQEFIEEVYSKVAEFRFKVQTMLEKDDDRANRKLASKKDTTVSDNAGLFEGLSSK